jgi:hypothetical protein
MDYSMFGAMLPQQAREEDIRSRMVSPNTFAQLNPLQQIVALGGNAGAMVGGAVGNMMGGRTAKEAEGAMIKEVFDKASQMSEDPAEQYAFASREFRRLGMNDRAMALEDRVGSLSTSRAKVATEQAKAQKEQAAAAREESLRTELANLPADATDEQIEAVVRKYGNPDQIYKTIERKQTARLAAQEREERDLRDHRSRIEIAQMNNASKETIAAMNRQFLAQQALMRQQDKAAERAAKNSGKTLPARLQTAEDDDFSAIDTASSVVADIKPIIDNLETNKLNLNKVNQLKMGTQAFFGSKDPEVLRYQELERNLTRFVNESLRLNKGVQTEGDAQRAAAEYQAAFSKNSTEGMKKALQELEKINNRQIENRKKQVDRRRKAQGVEAYFEKSDEDVMGAADRILQGE